MLPEAELRVALASIRPISIHGLWSRTVEYHLLQGPPPGAPPGSPPQPLWPGGAPLFGARFTPRSGFGTIYLASDEETARAEVDAVFRPARGPVVTLREQPWVIVSVDGILTKVLDLADPLVQSHLGTNIAELTGNWRLAQDTGQLAPTQLLGKLAYQSQRFIAIRYVSAKNPPASASPYSRAECAPAGQAGLKSATHMVT